ncbi:Vacuolar protein sorting-associated protein 53 [Malassezia brasiliensis]|uniref:Vacuolar protein sorting-associated protein 53 n=1 Tax=Malassezia brasiliensis TaxID=1821822 RepID=A0AAF0DSZ8_9BASI|nr:Vacuolar protein sorting-associated protein 53 [Malassezia brasiliensis]
MAADAVDALLGLAPGTAPGAADLARARAALDAKMQANRDEAAALRTRLADGALHDAPTRAEAADTLFTTLARLETHAARAEASVGEITAEIRWLDTAKRNVALSIVTLKRLQMLVNSTFHLEQLCAAEAFGGAAQTLQAVQALLAYFAPYSAVELVVQQRRRVDELRDDLRRKAMQAYEHAFQSARPHWDASDSPLPEAARAIDALGDETRTALIDWYCARQLREYRRVFRAVDEAGQLDNVVRRYAWIRRVLRTYADEHSAAFLPAWHVDQRLLSLFAEITRDDLKSVLVRQQPRLDADLLLGALNATNEFEAQVARQYARPFAEVVAAHRTAAAAGQPRTIAAAFTPYLHVFVDAQERRLGELFAQFGQQATGQAPAGSFEAQVAHHAEEPMKVHLSSTELFWFYRQTLERCAQLGEHAPFRELAALFARWLRRYVTDVLQPALAQRHTDADAHVRAVCLALNTADYCATTCTQLEQKLNEKVRDAEAHPVSLDGERQAFYGVVAGALQHLCRALYHATDAAFQQMLRPEVPWAHVEHTVERSAYMDTLAAALEHVGVVVRHEVENRRVVRSWCDKAVAIVVTRFMHTVVRLRPVHQRVAAQLRADADALATLLRELPQFGTHVWSGTPNLAAMHAAYDRIVEKQLARVTPVLAVLAAVPDEAPPPDALVHTYRTHLHDQSLSNFQKVLDLKGLKRLDQTPLVEAFLAAIDREPEPLPTTSALSHWSMDPAADTYAPPELPSERRTARNDTHEADGSTHASASLTASTPANAAAARLPDWMRFGSMLGAALGRSQRP